MTKPQVSAVRPAGFEPATYCLEARSAWALCRPASLQLCSERACQSYLVFHGWSRVTTRAPRPRGVGRRALCVVTDMPQTSRPSDERLPLIGVWVRDSRRERLVSRYVITPRSGSVPFHRDSGRVTPPRTVSLARCRVIPRMVRRRRIRYAQSDPAPVELVSRPKLRSSPLPPRSTQAPHFHVGGVAEAMGSGGLSPQCVAEAHRTYE